VKILILEPFYSNFDIDLAKNISDDIYSLIFNYGYILYLKDSKKINAHKNIVFSDFEIKDLELAKKTKTLYTETLRKIDKKEPSINDFEYMAKYISFLRIFLKENNIEFVTMHNDLRWQHSLAIEVCKELNIKYLVMESGLFRPNTITADFKGVNAYSSISKEISFYENLEFKEMQLKDYKSTILNTQKTNIKFALFIMLNKVGDILHLNTIVKNKSYSLLNYMNLFIKQKIYKSEKETNILPNNFIFIPLQVNTDTQILVHSDFKNIQEFINIVEKTFYSLNNDTIKLVFKIHPMEIGIVDYKFSRNSIVSNDNANELIQKSKFVITINSTVGLEAIQEYKTVMVLGNAFYKIEELVVCSNKEIFKRDLEYLINNDKSINHSLVLKFINYLKYEYQINGDLFNYDDTTFEQISKKIIN
jgi:capsular polysaccharide export protein